MKFKNNIDEVQYKILGLNEVEVKKRLLITTKAKDYKSSRNMKNNWRRKKVEMKKGIEKWTKSTSGKRFHRALGRFNALREKAYLYYNDLTPSSTYVELSMAQVNDALLGLSSIETHLYLELQYYEADAEAMVQFLHLVNSFIEDASILKTKLLETYISGKIENESYETLTDMIQFFQDPKMYIYAKRDLVGKRNDIDDPEFRTQLKAVLDIDMSTPNNEVFDNLDKLFI